MCSQETRDPDLVSCSARRGFLPALPLLKGTSHKLPTAELTPLPPKVCHPFREQHPHSLSPPARNRAVIRGVLPPSPPHIASCSPRLRASPSQQLLVRPLLPLMPPPPPLSQIVQQLCQTLKSILVPTKITKQNKTCLKKQNKNTEQSDHTTHLHKSLKVTIACLSQDKSQIPSTCPASSLAAYLHPTPPTDTFQTL